MYQQQLVYGNNELQDDYCLAEYAIPSGAQLKLLIAMRGGPIHAQRGNNLTKPWLLVVALISIIRLSKRMTVWATIY